MIVHLNQKPGEEKGLLQYDMIRDAILTCAQNVFPLVSCCSMQYIKLTHVSF